jgi:hypothetical protein
MIGCAAGEALPPTPRQGDIIGLRKTGVSLTEEFLTEEFPRRYARKKNPASTLPKSGADINRTNGSPNFEEFSSITSVASTTRKEDGCGRCSREISEKVRIKKLIYLDDNTGLTILYCKESTQNG